MSLSTRKTETAILHVTRSGPHPLAPAPCPGAPLDILVTDCVARYWILERPSDLADTADLGRLAAERFTAIYGDDPADWVIRVTPSSWAERWLACAIPACYATELPRTAAAEGWQVRQVQSRYLHEFNRCCRHLDADTAFCVATRECTTIGLIAAGTWRGIRVHPPLTLGTAGFGTLLQRDCRQAGLSSGVVHPVIVGPLRERARLAGVVPQDHPFCRLDDFQMTEHVLAQQGLGGHVGQHDDAHITHGDAAQRHGLPRHLLALRHAGRRADGNGPSARQTEPSRQV